MTRPLRFTRSRSSERASRNLGETMQRRREDNMIESTNRVRVYEVDGKEVEGLNHPSVFVKSHWNREGWVVLRLIDASENPASPSYAVSVKDLEAAVRNANNSNRHG